MEVINKWGSLATLLLLILIIFGTCGVKGKIDTVNKRMQSLEMTISERDSIGKEVAAIQREITVLEIAREVVYTNNAIVRTVKRPDDVMNDYNTKIKILQDKLNKIGNVK